MHIITVKDLKDEGAYAVLNEHGEKIVFLFKEKDDASRYAMMLEEQDYPEMHIIQVDDQVMIHTCESHGYNYAVISKNDIVVPPPKADHDII